MTLTLELPEDILDAIAQRAAAILADKTAATPEPWLTVDQAAAHMGISVSQLYSLCSARRVNGLPIVKEGSRSYFKATELDTWRASR